MANIIFRCDSKVKVEAGWDETVVDALLRSGTPVPFFCRSGICGQCKSVLVDGEVMEIGTAPRILSEEEIASGHILICRSVAVTDCEIVPKNLAKLDMEPAWPGPVQVRESDWVTPALFHFRVEAPAGGDAPTFMFHPGQYTFVQNAGDPAWDLPSRLYPATRPGQPFLDFYLSANTPARAGAVEAAFRVGSRVQMARPVGASALKEGDRGPVIIAAQGEGLPAVLSMLELLRLRDHLESMHVLVRGSGEHPLEQRIRALCADSGIEAQILEAAAMPAALERALARVTAGAAQPAHRANAYVKGDEGLVRQAREVLYARGMRAWEVHAEIIGAPIAIE